MPLVLFAGILLTGITWVAPGAWAATYWEPYIPPEVAFADDLRQKIALPAKININQGGLNQLKILPGFDEDIALKVMRNRPFVDIQDFYSKLPGLDKKRIDRLIEQVQPKVLFK
ncbi:ComEA family DNA-binding protein [Vampirovibrio sp.]|uniref:ComEA family DNA-binding protein n=1 Tax=Vampirovibrio sp. TaxID=2717857 RepID=UPI0035948CC3